MNLNMGFCERQASIVLSSLAMACGGVNHIGADMIWMAISSNYLANPDMSERDGIEMIQAIYKRLAAINSEEFQKIECNAACMNFLVRAKAINRG